MRQTAIVIFFIISFCAFFSAKYKDSSKRLYWFICFVLCMFAALRPIGIDQDSVGYQGYYELNDLIWLVAEPSYGVISRICQWLFNDFRAVLIVYAFAGVFLKFKAITRLTNLIWPTVLIYYSTYFLLHEFTQIRAGIASGIFLMAIPLITEKKWVKYLFVVLICILFHYSSAILIFLFLLGNKPLNKKWTTILSLLIPFGIVLHYIGFTPDISIANEVAKTKIETYQTDAETKTVALNVFNMVYMVKYLIFYVLLAFHKRITPHSRYFPLLLKIFGISLFSYLALSSNTIFAMRISEMYGVVEIILIPFLVYTLRSSDLCKFLIWVIAISYLFISIYSTELIYATPKL